MCFVLKLKMCDCVVREANQVEGWRLSNRNIFEVPSSNEKKGNSFLTNICFIKDLCIISIGYFQKKPDININSNIAVYFYKKIVSYPQFLKS